MSKLWIFLIIYVNITNYNLSRGQSFISKHPKVVGGVRSVQTQHPFIVSVLPLDQKDLHGLPCTGAILTDKWVITATHCLNKRGETEMAIVRAAVMDSLSQEGQPNSQDRRATNIKANKQDPKKDLAILEVSEPFKFDEYVRPITIAKSPLPSSLMNCIGIAYGFTAKVGPQNNSYLFSGPTTAGDYRYCHKKTKREFSEENVCLVPDDDNQAMSSGDTGGPLVCSGLLVGVFRAKENKVGEVVDKCHEKSCTLVYSFVGYFKGWLTKHVGSDLPEFKSVPAVIDRAEGETTTTTVAPASEGPNTTFNYITVGMSLIIGLLFH